MMTEVLFLGELFLHIVLIGLCEACSNCRGVSLRSDASFVVWRASKPSPPPAPSAPQTVERGPGYWWPSSWSHRSKVRSAPSRRSARCPRRSWGGWPASSTRSSPERAAGSTRCRCGPGWGPCSRSEEWAARRNMRADNHWGAGALGQTACLRTSRTPAPHTVSGKQALWRLVLPSLQVIMKLKSLLKEFKHSVLHSQNKLI